MKKMFIGLFLVQLICFYPSCKKTSTLDLKKVPIAQEQYRDLTLDPIDCSELPPAGGCVSGSEYDDLISSGSTEYVVYSDFAEQEQTFMDYLDIVESGDIIYLEDGVRLNLTSILSSSGDGNINYIEVPGGVTIAGSGNCFGAIIESDLYVWNSFSSPALFKIIGNDVRITGLRIYGPFCDYGECYDPNNPQVPKAKMARGILSQTNDNLEVDNCEFKCWPHAAIAIETNSYGAPSGHDIQIHHNYIHHNKQCGAGYGVTSDLSFVRNYSNVYEHNRHDIASSGTSNGHYEAACNQFNGAGVGHSVDVHAAGGDQGPEAGGFIYIHHNRFEDTQEENIVVRGRPDKICLVENNLFKSNNPGFAILQHNTSHPNDSDYKGNMIVINNLWNGGGTSNYHYLGHYVNQVWSSTHHAPNYFNIPDPDLDGLMRNIDADQKLDYTFGRLSASNNSTWLIKKENGDLSYYPLNVTRVTTNWVYLTSTGLSMDGFKFGYFDGDSKLDAFKTNGSNWHYLAGFSGSWNLLNGSSILYPSLKFGRFDNDGLTDIFKSISGLWRVSEDGSNSWATIFNSGFPHDQVDLGDFDGDGITDVLYTNGSNWVAYYGPWNFSSNPSYDHFNNINSSSMQLPNLILADFNANGKTDIIGKNGGIWSVSIDGTGGWTPLNTSNFPISSFVYGDLAASLDYHW